MFKLQYFKRNSEKIFFEKEFDDEHEAQRFADDDIRDYGFEYEIIDLATDKVVFYGENESSDDIIEGTLDMMYPDRDELDD